MSRRFNGEDAGPTYQEQLLQNALLAQREVNAQIALRKQHGRKRPDDSVTVDINDLLDKG